MSHFDPTDLQAQERDSAVNADRIRKSAEQEIDDLKWLMSNKRGRRFVFRVLERAGVYHLSFNTNALVMSFNDGKKNEGLRLMVLCTSHCPERYTEMLKESKE